MRWLGIGGFDAFQFDGLQGRRLTLGLPLQLLNEPALLNEDPVQFLHLMFQMSHMCFEAGQSLR
jgi:hypothetical protein